MFFFASLQPQERCKAERLYNQYAGLMYKSAYPILKDHSLAEDAVHQSFLRIIKNINNIKEDQPAKLKMYLIVTCRNVAIDLYHDQFLYKKSEIDIEYIEDQNHHDPLRSVIEKSEVDQMVRLIRQLKPIYSDVLILRFFCELEEVVIANSLDITIDALRKRTTRAKKMLRKLIEEGK